VDFADENGTAFSLEMGMENKLVGMWKMHGNGVRTGTNVLGWGQFVDVTDYTVVFDNCVYDPSRIELITKVRRSQK